MNINVVNIRKVWAGKFDWSNNIYVKHSGVHRQVKGAVEGFLRNSSV